MPTQQRLTRSSSDRMISGVAGGLATYFGIDPTIVRVLWVVACFAGGAGVLAYIVMAIVVPLDVDVDQPAPAGDPIRIAEERFARGEIDADQLRDIRETLRGSS